MSALRWGTLVGIAFATAACFGYRRVESVPAPGARVRLVLVTASDIATVTAGGTRERHARILEVHGTISASAEDTVAVRLGELRSESGALRGVKGRTALVATTAIGRLEQRRFLAANTALAGVGAMTLSITAFLVVIIISLTRGF